MAQLCHVIFASSIQTLLSASEFHRICHLRLAGFTAGREFHPALKTYLINTKYTHFNLVCQYIFYDNPKIIATLCQIPFVMPLCNKSSGLSNIFVISKSIKMP